jgi:hypothetical protein
MSGPGDIDGEVSGDEAAWRDLIARFDVPADRTSTSVPWPASEDLPEPTTSPAESATGPAGPTASQVEPGVSTPEHGAGPAGHGVSTAEHPAGAAEHGAGPAEHGISTAEHPAGPAEHGISTAQHPAGAAEHGTGAAEPAGLRDEPPSPVTSFFGPPDRTRVIRTAGDPRSYTPPDEEDGRYVPEPLPPPAKLDSVTKAALVGVIGGPGYLLIASMFLHWTISAEAALIAVAAFVAGFVTLVVKLGDPSGRDDDDDGAVL